MLGPSAQVGSNLPQVELMLGPFAGPKPPLGEPKPFQTPSQALPDHFLYIKEATLHPPGLGRGLGTWQGLFWVPSWGVLGSILRFSEVEKGPSQVPTPYPGPADGA